MRAVLLAVCVVVGMGGQAVVNRAMAQPVVESDYQGSGVSRHIAITLAKMVRLYGYRCDSVSAANKWVFSPGFSLYCNRWRYHYEVADKGGRWIVTVK